VCPRGVEAHTIAGFGFRSPDSKPGSWLEEPARQQLDEGCVAGASGEAALVAASRPARHTCSAGGKGEQRARARYNCNNCVNMR
jgi:hypothetical protein